VGRIPQRASGNGTWSFKTGKYSSSMGYFPAMFDEGWSKKPCTEEELDYLFPISSVRFGKS
jgi:hypothetical protein